MRRGKVYESSGRRARGASAARGAPLFSARIIQVRDDPDPGRIHGNPRKTRGSGYLVSIETGIAFLVDEPKVGRCTRVKPAPRPRPSAGGRVDLHDTREGLTRRRSSFIISHMTKYRHRLLDDTLALTKALADEHRLRALMALRDRELCLCQLAGLLRRSNSTTSKHLSILRQARLVSVRREGRWSYFRRMQQAPPAEAAAVFDWLDRALARSPQIEEDARRAAEIVRIDPEKPCRINGGR